MLVGTLLLAAAGLKLSGHDVSPYAQFGWLSASWVQLAVIEWEIVLGVWLLSEVAPRTAILAAVATFLGFGIVSAYLGIVGQASCGCFGSVEASPWLAFAVDVTAIALLLVARLFTKSATLHYSGLSGVLSTAVVLVCAAIAVGYLRYGSVPAALAKLRGETLTAPQYLDLGRGRPGEVIEGTATIQNWSDRSVRLVGGTSDCSCVTISELPVTIPPGESRSVKVLMKIPGGEPGQFTRTAEFWTDYDSQRKIRFRLGCYVEADATK